MFNDPARASSESSIVTTPARPPSRLDLNLLPARHRARRLTWGTVLTWLLLVALLAMLAPAWLWFARTTDAYITTAGEGDLLRQAVDGSGGSQADLDALATRVANVADEATQLEAALESLGIRRVVWSETLAVLVARTPAGITYTSISDEGESIRVEGLSLDEKTPLTLVQALTASAAFEAVRLEALDRVTGEEEEPAPTPTRANARPGATPSPTPTAEPSAPGFSFVLTLVGFGAATP
jgi:Tfp pilus assembly protein PilN